MLFEHMIEPFGSLVDAHDRAIEQPVVYHIDADYRLCLINRAWDAFAAANNGDHLYAVDTIGRSFWELIADAEMSVRYRTLFTIVRADRPISLTLRCDAPDRRRLLDLQLHHVHDGLIACVSGVVADTRRPAVRLLDRTLPRGGGQMQICSWCARLATRTDQWMEVEDAVQILGIDAATVLPQLVYTTCMACQRLLTRL